MEVEGYNDEASGDEADDGASGDEAEDEEYPKDKWVWPFKVATLRF